MPASPEQMLIGCHVDRGLGARFKAWARSTDGGAAAALRKLVTQAVDGRDPEPPVGCSGYRVTVRLKDDERIALLRAAQARGTTPANWLRSLAIVRLARRPQWNPTEVDALRELFVEVRRIGNNVNQIARALNVAVQSGEYPPGQGEAARENVELLRAELRRIVAVMSGNFDYWGLPDEERPTAAPGAVERDDVATAAERARIKRRPRRRPSRFKEE